VELEAQMTEAQEEMVARMQELALQVYPSVAVAAAGVAV
jgi:hypothetical protein